MRGWLRRVRQSPWSVLCSSIPTIQQHSSQCPGRLLDDKDFNRCRAYVHHIRHVGDIIQGCIPTIELSICGAIYDALELHGILPIINLRSYRLIDRMECSAFPRIIGPNVTCLHFRAPCSSDSLRSLNTYFPSLHVLKLFEVDIDSEDTDSSPLPLFLLLAPLPTSKSSIVGTEFDLTSLKWYSHLMLCGNWRWQPWWMSCCALIHVTVCALHETMYGNRFGLRSPPLAARYPSYNPGPKMTIQSYPYIEYWSKDTFPGTCRRNS